MNEEEYAEHMDEMRLQLLSEVEEELESLKGFSTDNEYVIRLIESKIEELEEDKKRLVR